MNAAQIAAFHSASGTTVHSVLNFLLVVFFVLSIVWAVLVLLGKFHASIKSHDFDVTKMMMVTLQVLGVLVIILFLVNVS